MKRNPVVFSVVLIVAIVLVAGGIVADLTLGFSDPIGNTLCFVAVGVGIAYVVVRRSRKAAARRN